MNFPELVEKNRSYRGYDHSRKVTLEELTSLIDLARKSPATSNVQPLKYYLVHEEAEVAMVQANTAWAGRFRGKMTLPHPGKEPTAFVIVCLDREIAPELGIYAKDVGIVSQSITLGAAAMDLGGIIISSFKAQEIHDGLHLSERFWPVQVIAVGKPDETVVLVEAENGEIAYYRDEDDVHYVPKRPLSELVLNEK